MVHARRGRRGQPIARVRPCARAQAPATHPAHTDNSLLDAYEVEMITRQLDLFIASDNSVSYQSIRKKRDKNNKSYSSWSGRSLNGFWLRQAMGMCRPARGDVVEAKAPARSARAGGRDGPRANAI
ncbi:hypothetical protein QJS10_CPA09g00384 [Acorus calamus]|uniref:Uncharacterized protein n=1 Tax=Acorus calamus TaxID=4465 RepID=A0AAV9E612_ACOCL|nr:hypothetical protein QJS10_CPA09g00384 [Acorus calamus]